MNSLNEYELKIGNEVVGYVSVRYEGLYCQISCSCRLSGAVIYRLVAVVGTEKINIGICAPKGKYFCVEKKFPAKILRNKTVSFLLVPKHQNLGGRFIPIRADEPFAYIAKLEEAYLANRDGNTYVVI